jgi:hypothetical protein
MNATIMTVAKLAAIKARQITFRAAECNESLLGEAAEADE